MKKLTLLIILFFMAFQPALNAQKKVVIVNHDGRYK
ncbi:MAG: hypothetical protein JWQ78_17, partial [Sediminibacterium sp.]|nr:hypothetical protein [Sediminibacterium sp.]